MDFCTMLLPTLDSIYGDGAVEQTPRYRAALDAFRARYGPGPVTIYRAPGRVNLIGEHTDYNHGFVLPVALDKDTLLLARPRADATVRLANVEAGYAPVEFALSAAIPPDPPGSWSNYARGPAQAFTQAAGRALRGYDGLVASAPPYGVPRGSGLSSSSALTVVSAVVIAQLNGLPAGDAAFAQMCADAEWYVGTRGGIMDHFASVLARRGHAMFLDCRPRPDGSYVTEHVPLPRGYRLIVVDSGVHHRNVGGGYNQRVAECRAGVALLKRHFGNDAHITRLRDVQDMPWAGLEPCLPEQTDVAELAGQGIELGDVPGMTAEWALKVRSRCRHVWTENRRVLDAMAAMRAGDVARLGELLNAAHASARDDYEISCPELEALVTAAREVDGVAGARLTGAGWGGCIIALVADAAVDEFESHVAERYRAATGMTPAIFTCRAGPGAGYVATVGG
jgi:galactokinase